MSRRKLYVFAFLSLLFAPCIKAQDASSIKISEVVTGNCDGLLDEYGNRPAWIELANTSWGTVSLQNCYLTNNRKALDDMSVPERIKLMSLITRGDSRTTLEAQKRVVFFADGNTNLGALHTNFVLRPGEENFVALFDGNARTLLDSVTIPASLPAGCSYARIIGDDMKSFAWTVAAPGHVTPGSANAVGGRTDDKVAEFKERDPHGFGMSILGMGIVFSCLLSLYVFFRVFGMFFRKKNESRAAQSTPEPATTATDTAAAPGEYDVYMAVIAHALSRVVKHHDEESGIITIKPRRSNWNPRISEPRG